MLLIVVGLSFAAATSCGWKNYDGTQFDLSPLESVSQPFNASDADYDYVLRVCSALPDCGGQRDASVCQYRPSGEVVAALGTFSEPRWSVVDPMHPARGVQYTTDDGDNCWVAGRLAERITTTRVMCLERVPGPGGVASVGGVVEDPPCNFIITLYSPAGCGVAAPWPSPPAPPSHLSPGSVFCICVLVFTMVYVVGGCCYKSYSTGVRCGQREACPHADFWTDLPSLARDGARHTWMLIRTGCRNAQDYQAMDG